MIVTKALAMRWGHGDRILAAAHDWSRPWYAKEVDRERIHFNSEFRATRGHIEITEFFRAWAKHADVEGMVMIEPRVKGKFSADNKDWGRANWRDLTDVAGDYYDFVQCGPDDPYERRPLEHTTQILTPTFLHACAILEQSVGIICTDGGLHHAAAALGKPAIVIWGCYSDPAVLGYPEHVNLYRPNADGLGRRQSHPACRAAMDSIMPAEVLAAMRKLWPID